MIALSFLFAVAGFAAFGLSTDAHHRRWFGGGVTSAGKGVFRGAAWLALVVSFAASIAARGWVYGPVLWFGSIMFGSGVVFLFLNLAPARFERQKK